MALHRRTLQELSTTPLLAGEPPRSTIVLLATGRDWRSTLHALGVGVPAAQRVANDHVVIELPTEGEQLPRRGGTVHILGVPDEEATHPVTQQLALRAQGVLAAPDAPRVCRSLPKVAAGDAAVGAYHALVQRVLRQLEEEQRRLAAHRHAPVTLESLEDAPPPSVGTRRCELALLGVPGFTAQELLTALDAVMQRARHRRCAHAGGGRDFVLLRGASGAGLRVADDRTGTAPELAAELARELHAPVLAAHVVGEQDFDESTGAVTTRLSWSLSSVSGSGTGAAFRDGATVHELAPTGPLDERASRHVAREVFAIEPEPESLSIHYERA